MNRYGPFFWIGISVILSILSHPTVLFGQALPAMSWIAFVAYVPLFYFVFAVERGKVFKKVFCFAFFFYLGALYWLYTALNGYGHLSPLVAVMVLLILCVILALYFSLPFLLAQWIEAKSSISYFWTLPIFWVACEWGRTHWPLGGFPWAQVGYTQWKFLTFIQISDLVGVYGVTALIVWINLIFLEIVKFCFQKKERSFGGKLVFVCVLLSVILIYGLKQKNHLLEISKRAPHFNLALLQGNIPQDEKWVLEKGEEILKIYQDMTREVFANPEQKVELVIWPEASFPYEIARDLQSNIDYIGSFSEDVLLGAVSYENKGQLPPDILYTPLDYPIYNSALLIQPGPRLAGAYFKHHLVPYGEYIPFKDILFFVKRLTDGMGEFQRGTEYNLLSSGPAKMGMLICYEDIFPEIAQALVKNGANLLVNITNDAWYGNSSALPQHLSFSAFRAVENRRSLVRATNTGMTASFDAVGKIWTLAPAFERKIIYDQVPLLEWKSFYSTWGDVFAYACLAFSALLMLGTLLLCRKN